MIGKGTSLGAITILNGSATGDGCSLPIDAMTHAEWEWTDAEFFWAGATDDNLARAVHDRIERILGRSGGARLDCKSPFPPSRGLKTSSAAGTAMVRAASDTFGETIEDELIDDICVDASIDAGVTLTGAFDDQVAVSRGKCVLTDNMMRRIVQEIPIEPWNVAIWVPEASITKSSLRGVDTRPVQDEVRDAKKLLLNGEVADALTKNGAAFHRLYSEAGLPVTDAPTKVALEAGALGAGLSGTGPAVAALFHEPTNLEPVDGGRWQWQRVVAP